MVGATLVSLVLTRANTTGIALCKKTLTKKSQNIQNQFFQASPKNIQNDPKTSKMDFKMRRKILTEKFSDLTPNRA